MLKAAPLLALMVAVPAGAAPPVTGVWSGGRLELTSSPGATRITTDCAEGDFAPLRPDGHGRFSAHGTYAAAAPGPQAADDPGGAPATIAGSFSGNTMTVTITTTGMGKGKVHHLVRGRHVKLVRCL